LPAEFRADIPSAPPVLLRPGVIMARLQRIRPCLWFDTRAEEAARFYTGIFKNSNITATTHYSSAGIETHKKPPRSVMTVQFELDGQAFTALNGGPDFKFNEAVSLEVHCESQEEIDYYWERLGEGGDPAAQICGWLKDRFGVSWQVVPTNVYKLYEDAESPGARAAMEALLKMKKIDMAALQEAYDSAEAVGLKR
jgi:predicted 3-demethylubiquinone-9 3-methyltransferase (glyoxalase superfamily)